MTCAAAEIDETDGDLLDGGAGERTRGPKAAQKTPERRCIVTRAVQSPDAMIRFVRDPEGRVVPDLKAVLPGRGAWVTAESATVAEAVKRKAFPRAFKGEAKVDSDLATQVETLLLARAVEGLSLANKAGAVIAGAGQVEEAARKGHILAVLHAREASRPESSKLDALAVAVARAADRDVAIVGDLSSDEMGLALGRLHVIHAALSGDGSQENVSRMALSRIARLATYRSQESQGRPAGAASREL